MSAARAKPGQARYNVEWENPKSYPDIASWIQPVKSGSPYDIHYYRCKLCLGKPKTLGNMGISALRKHMEDKKDKTGKVVESHHNKIVRLNKATRKDCFSSPTSKSNESVSSTSTSPCSISSSPSSSTSTPAQSAGNISSYLNNATPEVLKSWILWALHVVHSHQSINSGGGNGPLFQAMFDDSRTAQQFNLSASKLSYMINHGLAPYFKKNIMNELVPKGPRLPPKFTSCFDESFNRVTLTKQMDVHILHYNEKISMVERKYIGSQFMGHARASDTLEDFKQAHKELDIVHNLMQLSMDGPNVNWAFMTELIEYRQTEDPNAPNLINIGSCGIHVLNGGYKTAHCVTDWEVQKTLKASHGLFKKSPARRADFLSDNNIKYRLNDQTVKSNFPLKFCGHRWLENGKALRRFLELVDKLAIFLEKSYERKSVPAKDERFPLLLKNCNSKIFSACCEFSSSVCADIEPFLELFQAEKPLAVFLHSKMMVLTVTLMERFVKADVLKQNNTASKLTKLLKGLKKEENLLPLESINVGFAAKSTLKKLRTTEKPEELKFRKDVRAFLLRLVEKIFERSPLKYQFTRSISSLSPIEMSVLKPEILKQRFNCMVQSLFDGGWVSSSAAEKAEKQYNALIKNEDFLKEAKAYNIINDRCDTFYARVLDSSDTIDLQDVVRMVLILSHGNARVESGFSINDDILMTNMLEETIVAQRMVYEGVHNAGGAEKVEMTPELYKMVRNSYKCYNAAVEEKRKNQSDGQKRLAAKRKATSDLKHAVEKRKAAVSDLKDKITKYDIEISALQEQL